MEALTPSTTPKQYPASKPCTSALQDMASSFPSSLSGLSGDGGIPRFTMASALLESVFTMASAFSASAFTVASALLLAKAEPAVRANSKAKLKIGVRERFISSPPVPNDVPHRGIPANLDFGGAIQGDMQARLCT